MSSTAKMLGAFAAGRDLGHLATCPICKELDWSGIHTCKDEWEVIRHEYDDENEPNHVFADDAEKAAQVYAEEYFAAAWDYPSLVEIWVRRDEDDEWKKFDVSIEQVPSFYATPHEDQTEVASS